jgi:hypothetical protein
MVTLFIPVFCCLPASGATESIVANALEAEFAKVFEINELFNRQGLSMF